MKLTDMQNALHTESQRTVPHVAVDESIRHDTLPFEMRAQEGLTSSASPSRAPPPAKPYSRRRFMAIAFFAIAFLMPATSHLGRAKRQKRSKP